MAQGLSRGTRLTEYLWGLYEGKVSRGWYDQYRQDLESADPWNINHAIHLLIKDKDDYPRIEKAVARLIRAAGKNLDKMEMPDYPNDHPLVVLIEENKAINTLRENFSVLFREYTGLAPEDHRYNDAENRLRQGLKGLSLLRDHYHRLQYTLFPALEECGGEFGCIKLMWHIQDEVLRDLKEALEILGKSPFADAQRLNRLIGSFFLKSGSLIYREERILYPLALRALSPALLPAMTAELKGGEGSNQNESPTEDPAWKAGSRLQEGMSEGPLSLSRGDLTPDIVDLMLKNLPLDITFVDNTGRVRYYSEGKERIFPRTPGILGRAVENCHPPASVGTVKKIVEDLKSQRREKAEFWIRREERFIHIQYIPLFHQGIYRGILEVTQDATALRALEGERRLLDD